MLGIITATGDLDTTTAPAFNANLHDAIDNSDEAFVSVDCSAITFMDPAGYHALVDATNYATRRGRTLVIRNMSLPCARLIQFYDCDRELRLER
jgi:anti-anti-sigma factor